MATKKGRFITATTSTTAICRCTFSAGDHVLCARLRPSNIEPAVGSRKEIERIVKRIRATWPEAKIVLRGDSGFCWDELMAWCEPIRWTTWSEWRGTRMEGLIAGPLAEAKQQYGATQQPARVFVEFEHETVNGTWSRRGGSWPRQSTSTGSRIRDSW